MIKKTKKESSEDVTDVDFEEVDDKKKSKK